MVDEDRFRTLSNFIHAVLWWLTTGLDLVSGRRGSPAGGNSASLVGIILAIRGR